MNKLTALILTLILAVVSFAAWEQHRVSEQQDRERAHQALRECWQNAIATGTGASVCANLAKTLEDR